MRLTAILVAISLLVSSCSSTKSEDIITIKSPVIEYSD